MSELWKYRVVCERRAQTTQTVSQQLTSVTFNQLCSNSSSRGRLHVSKQPVLRPRPLSARWLAARRDWQPRSQWEGRGRGLSTGTTTTRNSRSTFLTTHGYTCRAGGGSRPGPKAPRAILWPVWVVQHTGETAWNFPCWLLTLKVQCVTFLQACKQRRANMTFRRTLKPYVYNCIY